MPGKRLPDIRLSNGHGIATRYTAKKKRTQPTPRCREPFPLIEELLESRNGNERHRRSELDRASGQMRRDSKWRSAAGPGPGCRSSAADWAAGHGGGLTVGDAQRRDIGRIAGADVGVCGVSGAGGGRHVAVPSNGGGRDEPAGRIAT